MRWDAPDSADARDIRSPTGNVPMYVPVVTFLVPQTVSTLRKMRIILGPMPRTFTSSSMDL
jgi:hypothetical protein